MNINEQCFPVMWFIAEEIPKCDRSSESYSSLLSCGAFYYAVQGLSVTFASIVMKWDQSNESSIEKYFSALLFMLQKLVLLSVS